LKTCLNCPKVNSAKEKHSVVVDQNKKVN